MASIGVGLTAQLGWGAKWNLVEWLVTGFVHISRLFSVGLLRHPGDL
jgi:hypothetical protein